MFRSRKEHRDLEAALRANRPEPREEFVASLTERIGSTPEPRRHGSLRLGFAGGITAAMLVALASFGGLGYAAAGASSAADKLQRVAGPATIERSSAQDQYGGRVTICHRTGSQNNPTQTITVNENAVPAHLRHGDTMGPCNGVAGASFTAGQPGATGGVLGAQTLPFTGLSILFAFFAGFALLAAGSAIRRTVRGR
jgi:hypothetical protein